MVEQSRGISPSEQYVVTLSDAEVLRCWSLTVHTLHNTQHQLLTVLYNVHPPAQQPKIGPSRRKRGNIQMDEWTDRWTESNYESILLATCV